MARRRLKDRNIRNLGKIGNGSYMVTLPIEYVRELKWQDNQKVTVELDKKAKRLIIKDWKK
jgi:antitoxin component of MazEF toxin-antitoxin module